MERPILKWTTRFFFYSCAKGQKDLTAFLNVFKCIETI